MGRALQEKFLEQTAVGVDVTFAQELPYAVQHLGGASITKL